MTVFFSRIKYEGPIAFGSPGPLSTNVVLVSGIAMTRQLLDFCGLGHKIVKHFNYQDHHQYTLNDLITIEQFCNEQSEPFVIFTTEKDMVKLKPLAVASGVSDRFAYLPMEINFGTDAGPFDRWITDNTL